jgi:uncharacterized protein YndB with AHSA1/START domain
MAPVKEVVFERIFNASPETVWQAWTDPVLLKEWWGPDNVSIPECEVDLRIGGELYIVMEAGEAMGTFKGTRWPMRATFTEVEAPTKLAYTARAWTEGQEETTTIDQIARLTLLEENGKTKMNLEVTITEIGADAGMAVHGMQAGYSQQFVKLNAFLEK